MTNSHLVAFHVWSDTVATWRYHCGAAFAFQHFTHYFFDCLWHCHACSCMFLVPVRLWLPKVRKKWPSFCCGGSYPVKIAVFMYCFRLALILKRRSGKQPRVFYVLLTVFSPLLKLIILLIFRIWMLSRRNSSNYGLLKLVRLSFILYFIALSYVINHYILPYILYNIQQLLYAPSTRLEHINWSISLIWPPKAHTVVNFVVLCYRNAGL